MEDDEAFKEVLGSFFESHFFDVTAVSSGVDGVREIMKCDYDVIVCDMMMPCLPGDMFYFAVERISTPLLTIHLHHWNAWQAEDHRVHQARERHDSMETVS